MPPVDVRSPGMLGELSKRVRAGPLTLVLVYADWCGHCQNFKPLMDQIEAEPNRSVQIARVRDDVFPKSAVNKNKIEGYPSLMLVNSAGTAVNFEDKNGNSTAVVPEYTNLNKMKSLVRTAGTPQGIATLNSMAPNSVVLNTKTAKNNGNTTSSVTLEEVFESIPNEPTSMTMEPPSLNSITTAPSLPVASAPSNIVADRLNGTTVSAQNSTLQNSAYPTVKSLTAKNMLGGGCGEGSCGVLPPQGGGGLWGALVSASKNLATPAALFLAAEAVAGKRSRRRRSTRRAKRS